MGAAGFEGAAEGAQTRSDALTSAPAPAVRAPSSAGLPSAEVAFIEAAARLAAAALARGDRAEARRILQDALRVVDARPPLRVVDGGGRS
jgi:hypothetical protein